MYVYWPFSPPYTSMNYKISFIHFSIIYNHQDMEAAQLSTKDDWIKQLWDIYTMEYYLAIKTEENSTLCNSLDGPREQYAK